MSAADDSPGLGDEPPYVVESGPPGTRFREVRRFREIDSTNRYLLETARRSDLPTLVAVAEYQTAGRGRLGRRWEAPPGANLLVSVLVHPELPVGQLHLCTAAVALSAADACSSVAGLDVSLKWPNDLMVGHRKLAGVLAESVPASRGGGHSSDAGRAVVVGLGLNVLWPEPEGADPAGARTSSISQELSDRSTSILRETALAVRPEQVLAITLSSLDRRLDLLAERAGRVSVASEYRTRCATVGQQVLIQLSDGELRGVATDITPEGHLVVDQGACFTTVTAGDVVHVQGKG